MKLNQLECRSKNTAGGTGGFLLHVVFAFAAVYAASADIQSGLPDEGTQRDHRTVTFSTSPTLDPGDRKIDDLVTEVIKARTLRSVRAAVNKLIHCVSKPSDYAAVKTSITSVLSRYPNLSQTQRDAFSTIIVQLLVDGSGAGANRAGLLLSIRMEALSAVYAETSSEITDSLAQNTELRAELDEAAISEAFHPLGDVLPGNRLAYVKQLFLNCTQKGDASAGMTTARAASGVSRIERNGDRSGGNSPANSSPLLGTWSAVVIGEANGMSVESYYTFQADGTYSRTSQAAFSGGGGTYIGRRGQSGGSWSLTERTLCLTPDNGQPSNLKISSLSNNGMITVRPNGTRLLWEKKN